MNKHKVKKVPFFNYPQVFVSQEQELLSVITDVGRRGAFIMQQDLEQFEEHLAQYLGAKYVVGMSNATDGLHLSLRAAGIGPDDEVIFCSHTMVATPAAVHFAGAAPIPVECGDDHLIDPASVEAAITPRTKAILVTQLNGRTAEMDTLQKIADQHNLLIFEDAAQALGSRFKGKFAGTFGKAAAISFYPAKTLGCLGDGGCVVTDDKTVYDQLLLLRDHGRNAEGDVVMWGLNTRLDNIQAAILDYKLKSYDQTIKHRRNLAVQYHELLMGMSTLRLPEPPEEDGDHYDIFQNYEIEAEARDELQQYLKERGVGTLVQWGGKAVHQFPHLNFEVQLPKTEELFQRMIMLPMNQWVTHEDVDYVCACIADFYQSPQYLQLESAECSLTH